MDRPSGAVIKYQASWQARSSDLKQRHKEKDRCIAYETQKCWDKLGQLCGDVLVS